MAEPFIAEIRIFAGNFAPRGWAFCNGTILPIAQNTALFSLLGTTFGGDGRVTLGLPNLQGRAAMHPGNGPGLTSRRLGEIGGTPTVTLTNSQIPSHTHDAKVTTVPGNQDDPAADAYLAAGATAATLLYAPNTATSDGLMNPAALGAVGGGQAHNNMMPYLALNYIIALTGLYPSRA